MVKNVLIALFIFISVFETIFLLWLDYNNNKQKQLAEALFDGRNVIKISESPDVYVTIVEKKLEIFYSFMIEKGWIPLEDERLGSIFIFERSGQRCSYTLECNSYFAFWTKDRQWDVEREK